MARLKLTLFFVTETRSLHTPIQYKEYADFIKKAQQLNACNQFV